MTLTMAVASTLLNIWLGSRIARMRMVHKVSIGDGGALPLIARMRAQANFIEWAPFFLVLLALIEMARGQPLLAVGARRLCSSSRGSSTPSGWTGRPATGSGRSE